jgi:RND superfamily putative drug exporter
MSTQLYRIGRWAASRPWWVVGMWLVAAMAVVVASTAFGGEMSDSFDVPGVDSQRATELLSQAGSDQAGVTARVVAAPIDGGTFAGEPASSAALTELQTSLEQLPEVVATSQAVSPDGRVAVVTVQYPVLSELGRENLDDLKHALDAARAGSPLQIEAGGELYFTYEQPESAARELIGIGAAIVILLVAFGSLIAMGLPIVIALFGLALGIASMSLVTYLIEIPSWAPQIATMVGLGVGIDYALFLVTRHREFMSDGFGVAEAAGRAVATAGQAVIFAGGTVVIAILGLGVAGVPVMTAAGVATSVIVLMMVVASVTLLPALLGLSGGWINRLGIHRRGRYAAGAVGGHNVVSAGWQRWGRHVSRHAWQYAIGTTVGLLALAAPVLAIELGFPDDGTQPESRTERRAYDLVSDGFGPGANGPLVIAVDLSGATRNATPGASADGIVPVLATAISSDPGVAGVAEPVVDTAAGVATIVAFPNTSPQEHATFDTVERLRHEVFPDVLSGTGVSAHVGGPTANFGDVANRVSDRLPLFIAAVVVLSFMLLMFVFRSVLVALKAAVLNLLSIGASYGLLVMVFQWGWGKSLIGLESTVPIVSFIPMFMFAVLFGLSMDYEVFLLSRVREEYVATGDNETAVIRGLAGTARVITSAALIMISVFAGFVLGNDPLTKMMGLGLASAILIDATVVRVVLVPATMQLLGDANWWLPRWLDRRMPTIDIDGGFDSGFDGGVEGGVDGGAAWPDLQPATVGASAGE